MDQLINVMFTLYEPELSYSLSYLSMILCLIAACCGGLLLSLSPLAALSYYYTQLSLRRNDTVADSRR
jgi:hypothetical protein